MQEVILSVVVITYNQEEYIAQTLDSILNQEHTYKYEIIIGEDSSSDNTKKVIEEYVEKYPEIIKPMYNNSNMGLIKNYFNVISRCQGKYIMECAGDDYWLPGKVKRQIDFLENNPDVGMCFGNVETLPKSDKKIEKKNRSVSFNDLIKCNCIPALTICCRAKLIDNYIKEINPIDKKWLMEDYPMWLYVSLKNKIVYLPEVFGVYRILENSISHSVSIDKQVKFNKSENDIRNFYLNIQNKDLLEFDENRNYFNLHFSLLLKNYDELTFSKCLYYGEKIKKITIKEKIKFYLVKYGIFSFLMKHVRGK